MMNTFQETSNSAIQQIHKLKEMQGQLANQRPQLRETFSVVKDMIHGL